MLRVFVTMKKVLALSAPLCIGRFSKNEKNSVLMELTFWSQDGGGHVSSSFPKSRRLHCPLSLCCHSIYPLSPPEPIILPMDLLQGSHLSLLLPSITTSTIS